ncbi:MAG: hypothetical protein GEU74_08275 [Nitriliruptorales bacterium]|nr:hypothetical protein [Nitriliruptorales bacterium]
MIVLSFPLRFLVVLVLTAALTTGGLVGPAAGEPAPDLPEVVSRQLSGLPAERAGGRISRAVATPMPFSMVGFQVPAGTEMDFRVSEDGKTGWGPWTPVEVDEKEGPDPDSAEAAAATPRMSEPVWVGEAAGIQTRVRGGGAAARPERVGVHLVDSSGLGRSWGRRLLDRARAVWRGTPPAAQAVPSRPAIVTRAQWGADERLRRGSPSYASRITMGIVHHTAGANGYTRAQADDVVRGVYRYHTGSNGWSDIGYNFLVDRFGTIYEGRYGGVRKPVIGAHAGGFNTGTFGVSLMGSFDSARPSRKMKAGLRRLLAWKYDLHHTDVLGTTKYTSSGSSKYAAGRTVKLNRLSGHRDVSATACPGASVYSLLPRLRKQVARRQGPVLLDPQVSRSAAHVAGGRLVDGPIYLRASLRPAGSWTVRVFDAAGQRVFRKRGSGTTITAAWSPTTAAPGVYRYKITSPDRRGARGRITLSHPTISASASPRETIRNDDGSLAKNITFSARLYAGARWDLQVLAPNGTSVLQRSGTGPSFSYAWPGPGAAWPTGNYSWTVRSDDVRPVTGTVRLLASRTDRTATATAPSAAAVALSGAAFGPGGASHVVLTRDDLPRMALAAGPLAGTGGPVLYTGATVLPSDTLDEIERVLPPNGTVYVMGGKSVISEEQLTELPQKYRVSRLGASRAAKTAALAAQIVLERSGSTKALVVSKTAGAWRQGAAATGYGARHGAPVLFTDAETLSPVTRDVLSDNGVTRTFVVGDTSAVSESVRAALPSATRISGSTFPKAAVASARKLYGRVSGKGTDRYVFFNVARGDGWARVLAAAPLAAQRDAPPLVVNQSGVPSATAGYLRGLGYTATAMGSGTVVGNRSHVNRSTQDALSALLQ